MTKAERKALETVLANADTLLDAGPTGSGITNMEVMEALLGDIRHVLTGAFSGTELAQLIKRDAEYTK